MPDLSITSLRGGMNNTDAAIALPDDQGTSMVNVELTTSMLGERRKGTSTITLPSFLSARDRVPFLYRHLPTADEADAQLWALGVTGTTTAKLGYKTTAWTEVTISDTPTLTGLSQYRWAGATLHGKLHLAYPSNQDRLHVWDGTTLRRSGFTSTISAPTAADAGSGSLAGTRYGRVRFVEVSGSTVLRRSEPSTSLTFAPSGTGASITWTRPTAPSEGETHWEIELSTDDANYYRMSRIAIGTTTYSDTASYSTSYSSGTLSEDTGDYTPLWSAKYLTVDNDRLILAGSWTSDALASRVGWTPVYNADGVGNDERMETDTDPTLDLDTYRHGAITGLSSPVLGAIWVFKARAIYKLIRTGQREKAYVADLYTDAIGAIHGSVVTGVDEAGQPCLYAIDREQGPYRLGVGGIKRCGEDLRTTWQTMNADATKVAVSAIYYPAKKQIIWNLALDADTTPTLAMVLHTDKARTSLDGVRKGYTTWTGTRATALSMCLFADNIEANTSRSSSLVPFLGLEGNSLVHLADTGDDDNDTTYTATETTKPYMMGSLLRDFSIRAAALLGTSAANATVAVSLTRDFGAEEPITQSGISFAQESEETSKIAVLDALSGAEFRTVQFTIADDEPPVSRWAFDRRDVTGSQGQGA